MNKLKLLTVRVGTVCVDIAVLLTLLFAIMYLLEGQYDAACAWFLFVAVSQLEAISLTLSKDK
jgi:hypothetical protein